MPIYYALQQNMLTKPPSYSCKAFPNVVFGYTELARAISLRNPTLPTDTVETVLYALRDEMVRELADGNSFNLNGFFSAKVTLPVRLDSPSQTMPPASQCVDIAFLPAKPFKADIRTAASLSRMAATEKAPNIKDVLDSATGFSSFMTELYGCTISGSDMKFDQTDANQGVFITSPAGNIIPQLSISYNKPKKIIFVPTLDTDPGPGGAASVENQLSVTTKYTDGGQYRTGSFSKYIRTINVLGTSNAKVFLCGDQASGVATVTAFTADPGTRIQLVSQYDTDSVLYLFTIDANGNTEAKIPVAATGSYVVPIYGGDTVTVNVASLDLLTSNTVDRYTRYFREYVELNALS